MQQYNKKIGLLILLFILFIQPGFPQQQKEPNLIELLNPPYKWVVSISGSYNFILSTQYDFYSDNLFTLSSTQSRKIFHRDNFFFDVEEKVLRNELDVSSDKYSLGSLGAGFVLLYDIPWYHKNTLPVLSAGIKAHGGFYGSRINEENIGNLYGNIGIEIRIPFTHMLFSTIYGSYNYYRDPATDGMSTAELGISFGIGLMGPEIKITNVNINDIYTMHIRYYENNSIGYIELVNKSGKEIEIVSINITDETKDGKKYIDITQVKENQRLKHSSQPVKISLMPKFFQEDFLCKDIKGNQRRLVKVKLEYRIGEKIYTQETNRYIRMYGSNYIPNINDKTFRMIGHYITHENKNIEEFAGSLINEFESRIDAVNPLAENIIKAAIIFEGLRTIDNKKNIHYKSDQTKPAYKMGEDYYTVDYFLYPMETFEKRGGDCEDLTILYCALLESAGIETAIYIFPHHINMMFNSKISENNEEFKKAKLNDDRYIVRENGMIWIPVEVTYIENKTFYDAWMAWFDVFDQIMKKEQDHKNDTEKKEIEKKTYFEFTKELWKPFKPDESVHEELPVAEFLKKYRVNGTECGILIDEDKIDINDILKQKQKT